MGQRFITLVQVFSAANDNLRDLSFNIVGSNARMQTFTQTLAHNSSVLLWKGELKALELQLKYASNDEERANAKTSLASLILNKPNCAVSEKGEQVLVKSSNAPVAVVEPEKPQRIKCTSVFCNSDAELHDCFWCASPKSIHHVCQTGNVTLTTHWLRESFKFVCNACTSIIIDKKLTEEDIIKNQRVNYLSA